MKIVFAGTPEFASKHLELLIESDNTILKVLTQPDRKSGRGKKMNFSEVKEVALREGIEVLQPESVKTDEFANTLRKYKSGSFACCGLWNNCSKTNP